MQQPQTIELPPEARGYIQGLKDQLATLSDMAAQRAAEVFGLHAQLAGALKRVDELQTAAEKRKRKRPEKPAPGPAEPPANVD